MRHPTRHYEWEAGPGIPEVYDLTGGWALYRDLCNDEHPNAWTCTRRPGHTQRHAAGDGIHVQAVWG